MIRSLDTNIILLDANNVNSLGQNGTIVAIAETAIDELDSKKSVVGEIGYQAREFGRILTKADKLNPIITDKLYISVYKTTENVEIWIIGVKEYPTAQLLDEANIRNDRKIIYATQLLQDLMGTKHDVVFVTNDIMCGIRAEPLGLTTSEFKMVEKIDYEFIKHLEVPDGVFKNLHNAKIIEVDPNYQLENYNYMFASPSTAQVKLATIANGVIAILGKDTEAELRRQELNPLNAGQLLMSRVIQDPLIDLIVVDSKAGTGKTAMAVSNAMKLIKGNNPYNSIMYIRASVQDVPEEEEIGFLKGDINQKTGIYLEPIENILYDMAFQRLEKKKLKGEELEDRIDEMIEKFKADYSITARTTLGMRGTNIPEGTIVITDEGQNQSDKSLQKVMTRPKKNVKFILIGSNLQIDNPYLTKYTNGLSTILNDCATEPEAPINRHVVSLGRVVRSPFAEYSENVFTKKGK